VGRPVDVLGLDGMVVGEGYDPVEPAHAHLW
jgi:hypothetical protein